MEQNNIQIDAPFLKAILIRENMHQYALAVKVGISEERLSKILRGRAGVKERLLRKIAKVLRVDINLLVDKSGVSPFTPAIPSGRKGKVRVSLPLGQDENKGKNG